MAYASDGGKEWSRIHRARFASAALHTVITEQVLLALLFGKTSVLHDAAV